MQFKKRFLIAASGLLLAAPSIAEAQRVIVERRPTVVVEQERGGWLGFSYEVRMIREPGRDVRRPIVITRVVEDSPAERAGLMAGDTLISINDIRVSEDLLASLVRTLRPGDEVEVRLHRAGRERVLTVQAAERPAAYAFIPEPGGYMFEIDPDSIRGRMRIYLDSVRVTLDSLKLPRIRIERTPEGMYMYTDTGRVIIMPPDSAWRRDFRGVYNFADSLRTRFWYRFPADSMRIQFDSTFARVLPNMRALAWHADSLRANLDSLRWVMPQSNIWLEAPGRGITIIGSRAIAGAELTELNPGLGAYFGTDEGVLVVRVPDGTPAANAGLQAGDVIIEVNGGAVDDVSSLRRRISSVRGGDPIRLVVLRKNQRRTIELKQN